MPSSNKTETTPEKPASLKEKLTKMRYLNLVAFVAVFGAFAASVVFYTSAAPKTRTSISVPTIYLSPSSQKINNGNNLTIGVYEDSLSQPVNAVQANLSFDPNVFDFVSIDGTGSNFEIEAQASSGVGTVNIGRGHVGSLTGKQLIALLTLRPKSSQNRSIINFKTGTMLSSATTNTDVLKSRLSGTYTVR